MNFGIILCGGTGSRMGREFKTPKQYIKVNDKYIFAYCLEVFCANNNIDKIIICADKAWLEIIEEASSEVCESKNILFADPGETRQMSVYNSMKVARTVSCEDVDLVVIHDGARPLVSDEIINNCIYESRNSDGAIATIPVNDTIYQSENSEYITNIPKRNTLRAGQTPEAFRLKKYLELHENCAEEVINNVTGGAEFAALNGMKISFSEGSPSNLKITTKEDLRLFTELVG